MGEAVYEYGLYQGIAFEKGHGFGEHVWRYTLPGHGQALRPVADLAGRGDRPGTRIDPQHGVVGDRERADPGRTDARPSPARRCSSTAL